MENSKYSTKLVETRQFKHFNAQQFQNYLSNAFSAFPNFNDVNYVWENWKEIFLDIANQHAPLRHKAIKSEYIPWMTNEIKEAMSSPRLFKKESGYTELTLL